MEMTTVKNATKRTAITTTLLRNTRGLLLPAGLGLLAAALPASAQLDHAGTGVKTSPATSVKAAKLDVPPMAVPSGDNADEGAKFYNEHVRPILVQNCFKCHTDQEEGGLRLDSRAAILKGGDDGPALVPHDPDKSMLIDAIKQKGDLKMPPKGKHLVQGDIETLVKWVKMGAPTDAHEDAQPIVAVPNSPEAGDEFFETKIRPILSTECGSCHMSDKRGGLSMLTRDSIMKGGDLGAVIIPGDPDKSLLITAVHQNTELRMPKNGRLSDAQIADLAQWIRIGAPWPKAQLAGASKGGKQITAENRNWWSFQPLHDFPVPAVKNATWAQNDIDKFVLAKLEAKGLTPSKRADKLTLIRRASLDLIGLPPTPDEIADFENDNSPDAWAKVVDRLLASPRYGERWGRHWLDVARYGDDDIRGLDPRGRGYMPLAGAYTYRDWVISAFNKDLPYDQFVRMQLAGDMMEKNPKPEMLKATGFLGGAPWIWDQAEPVQGRADERNERIDAVTRGMLGLTVACARCHDHKYDPILQRDYYALGGVFANATYEEYNFVPDNEVNFWKERFKEIDKLGDMAQEFNKSVTDDMAKSYASQAVPYMVAAWRVTGKLKMPVDQAADSGKLDEEVLERWVKFLGKPETFYPYLHDWHMMIAAGGSEDQAKELAESFQERIYALEEQQKDLDEENEKIKIKYGGPTRRKKDAKPNEFETYDEFCPGCTLELKVMNAEDANLYTDLFVRSLSSDSERGDPGLFSFRGWGLKKRLGVPEQQYMDNLEARQKKLRASLPEQYPFVHGMAEKKEIADIPLNLRGNPHSLGDVVPRAFPAVLRTTDAKPYDQGSGRLQLANDIVNSPLAMRVIVNRAWKWHFGTGIVNTPDNFGKVGDPPSDPELLDYLATSFKKDGMSMKKLQRMIMLSATYQQDSHESEQAKQIDPQNRFYSHFSLQRLDAEQIRDSILFTAGDLNLKETGGPAKPLSSPANKSRTVYSSVSRFRIDPFLQAFDFPVPNFTAEQRFTTNVPVQRLYFMNSSFVYGQSEALVKRVYSKGDDTARITEAYRLLFGRAPTPQELQLGLDYLKTTPDKPGYIVDHEPETAWKQYARVLYSSNEFEYLR
jgi:mono/diheme cytochrome c family protein